MSNKKYFVICLVVSIVMILSGIASIVSHFVSPSEAVTMLILGIVNVSAGIVFLCVALMYKNKENK